MPAPRNIRSPFPRSVDATGDRNARGRISLRALGLLSARQSWSVHSMFANSLNLEASGKLLHIGPERIQLCPFGISLPDSMFRTFLEHARVGMRAIYSEDVLTLDGAFPSLGIDISSLEICKLSLATATDGTICKRSLESVLEEIRRRDVPGRSGIDRSPATVACLTALENPSPDANTLQACIEYLLGRGRGLTPSGDDVLCGYAAACWILDRLPSFPRLIASAPLERTSDVARSYLEAISEGDAPEGYLELSRALRREPDHNLARIIDVLLSAGATSGADGLLGFALAVKSYLAGRSEADTRTASIPRDIKEEVPYA